MGYYIDNFDVYDKEINENYNIVKIIIDYIMNQLYNDYNKEENVQELFLIPNNYKLREFIIIQF